MTISPSVTTWFPLDTSDVPKPLFRTWAEQIESVLSLVDVNNTLTPPSITADQNNYAPTGFAGNVVLRLSSDAARAVTGIVAGVAGQLLILHNVGAFPITLSPENPASTATNRFATGSAVTIAANQSVLAQYDGVSQRWRAIGGTGVGGPALPSREVLTAARSYYVRADGSDSNNGLTDSAGGAFLTVQKAVDTVASLDLGIFDATIFVGVGTWTAQTVLKSLVGAGRCIIRGINSNTVDTVFNVTGAAIFSASSGFQGTYHFAFLRTQTTTSGPHFNVAGGGNLQFGAIDFGPAPSSTHVQIGFGNFVLFQSNITISGSASAHIQAFDGGQIRQQSLTVTLTGTPAFSTFAVAGRGGTILANGSTYSGAATGTRFSATQAGGILTNTGSASTAFAGSVNGSATSPGWFA